jgi:hypothetical protein
MSPDEERRLVFEKLEEQHGTAFARGLMRMVPPMNWEELATKADLEKMATKADLEKMATKADLEKMATKADLEATNAEVGALGAELRAFTVGVDHRFETTGARIEAAKHEVIAVVRGELSTAIISQTRQLIVAMTSAVVALGGIALGLARFA